MINHDINLHQLEIIAEALDDLLTQFTFVGGCTTVLLVDEAAMFGIRATDDVDVIVDVATRLDYQKLSDLLRKKGFIEDMLDGPICRWLLRTVHGTLKLDVMPLDATILGFSNRWYPDAMRTAENVSLRSGRIIKVVNAMYFLATKFEAYEGRGKGDYFSHDMEDIIFVLENRRRILFEIMDSGEELKKYLAEKCLALLGSANFLNVLPGLLNNADAASELENKLRIISKLQ